MKDPKSKSIPPAFSRRRQRWQLSSAREEQEIALAKPNRTWYE
jgi:hypothetical protein